jgi:hypothetical protein
VAELFGFRTKGFKQFLQYCTALFHAPLRLGGKGGRTIPRLSLSKLLIEEPIKISVFGNDASYLWFGVQLNRILLPVVVVIILALVESKVGFPVDLWPKLVCIDYDGMDVVYNPVAEIKGQPTIVKSTCQEECDLVVEFAAV